MKKHIFVTLAGYICFSAASAISPEQGGNFNDIELDLEPEPEDLENAIFVPDAHVEEFEMSVVEPLDEEEDINSKRGLRHGRRRYRYCRHRRRYINGYYYRKLEIGDDQFDDNEEDLDWPGQDRELGSMEYKSRKKPTKKERNGRHKHRGYDCRRRRGRRRRRRNRNRAHRGRNYGYRGGYW